MEQVLVFLPGSSSISSHVRDGEFLNKKIVRNTSAVGHLSVAVLKSHTDIVLKTTFAANRKLDHEYFI